jgi:Cft2 family RNA processing exonuclease
MGGKNIMLDCGMHMGFQDERKFPDFTYVGEGDLTSVLDCVIVTHFHLDHCGALPYLTEMVGYSGPIFMTHPTKAISPLLLVSTGYSKGLKYRTNFLLEPITLAQWLVNPTALFLFRVQTGFFRTFVFLSLTFLRICSELCSSKMY